MHNKKEKNVHQGEILIQYFYVHVSNEKLVFVKQKYLKVGHKANLNEYLIFHNENVIL